MKRLLFLFLLLPFLGVSQNTIKEIYIEDWARDWVFFTTSSSVGVTVPATTNFNVNGAIPNLVKLVNDTTVGLRFASNLSISGTYDLDYVHAGSELGGLPSFANEPVDNRITMAVIIDKNPGNFANYFLGDASDFNVVHSLTPGVKYYFRLAAGDYGTGIDIYWMTDVTFIAAYTPDDSIVMNAVNLREGVIHSGVIGHPAQQENNIKIRNDFDFFGIYLAGTGNFIIRNTSIHHVVQGVQMKTVPDVPTPPYTDIRLDYQTLETKYVDIRHTLQEAWYIGGHIVGPVLIKWKGYGLTVDSAGYDGFQYRNGDTLLLKNCSYGRVGSLGGTVHGHGVAIGSNTKWSWVENVSGIDAAGNGLFINGEGIVTVKNCTFNGDGNLPYIINYNYENLQDINSLTVNFVCTNTFNSTRTISDPRTPDIRRDPAKIPMTINISAETVFVDPMYIEDGINGTNNGIVVNYDVTGTCDEPVPPGGNSQSGKWKYKYNVNN
jgi:hypothetical protein